MKIHRMIVWGGVSAALALGFAACGKEEPAKTASSTPAAGQSLLMGKGGVGADASKPAAASPAEAAPAVPADDSTADAALTTWLARLAAGDFDGAAEISVAESPGRVKLADFADRIEAVRADPSAGEGMANTTVTLITNEIKTITWERKSETPTVVEYELIKGEKRIPVQVQQVDGAWRVMPPPGGLPN